MNNHQLEWFNIFYNCNEDPKHQLKTVRNRLASGKHIQQAAGAAGLFTEFLPAQLEASVSQQPYSPLSWQILANSVAGDSPLEDEAWSYLTKFPPKLPLPVTSAQCSAFEISVWYLILNSKQRLHQLCTSPAGLYLLDILVDQDRHPDWQRESILFRIVSHILSNGYAEVLIKRAALLGFRSIYFVVDAMTREPFGAVDLSLFPTLYLIIRLIAKQLHERISFMDKSNISEADLTIITYLSESYKLAVSLLFTQYERLTLSQNDPTQRIDIPYAFKRYAHDSSLATKEVLLLLCILDQQVPRKTLVQKTPIPSGSFSDFCEAVGGVKRECVHFITFASHMYPATQDIVRNADGLSVILSQCNIDDLNPYLREVSVFCIRHLLQNNPENQAYVANLNAVGVSKSEVLEKAGYDSQIDNDGKVKLVSKKSS
ncbi:ATXN10 protein [Schizosaccharomyces cryophilus OY26]|uniref:Ataxin-10 homolog n=1 Tax=Schizosaccharomyces cryophilus (strain OY26 / ATCC MYA-4695 / CBS 11777 / NBRC 106824 / NRRL Y48691) TaxID=653667 RepID=S9VU60_SCHCR|nr:ATXN10 protein [Schizosaccharomyces cryophilus OY26]EPY51318.1 ATXN10 protein [Schizosaccharomyces cryophilus OY26]